MSSQVVTGGTPLKKRPSFTRKKTDEAFKAPTSIRAKLRASGNEYVGLQVIYLGIAITGTEGNDNELSIGITAHDGTYSIGYEIYYYQIRGANDLDAPSEIDLASTVSSNDGATAPVTGDASTTRSAEKHYSLPEFVIRHVDKYRQEHNYKIIGGAMTEEAHVLCPSLCSQLWKELDIVCFKFKPFSDHQLDGPAAGDVLESTVDEESDSVVRKAIEQFGPNNNPRLMVKYRNEVGVDSDGLSELSTLKDFESTVHANTWTSTMQFVNSLKQNKTKIAFFNSTPQGGGVALMRHALIRFLRLAGVDCKWYVPRPKPEVFRITKNNHNILQGVDQTTRLTAADIEVLDEWCQSNATRYWTSKKTATRKGGPLASRADGGADVIIVDDPQMPKLVSIAKELDPTRPVIYRSHIQVRSDLTDTEGSPASEVWNWIWSHVQHCDVFASHPVRSFVPKCVTPRKVGYMPATTDWLDGLNKPLSSFDLQYYMHEFFLDTLKLSADGNVAFRLQNADEHRPYIVQIARFDPAKGIPDVLAAYAHFRREYIPKWDTKKTPQLVIAGHGAIDDPDAAPIYKQTMDAIKELYADLEKDIIVMRVGPTDQILNALMTRAHVALQLSTREGFEVKVSEALKHGKPIIAARAGGIPLQVLQEHSGFLVEPRDYVSVAKHLYTLFHDTSLYESMCVAAENSCSDEVSTVGNALCWLYLADAMARGERVEPNSGWINDMARRESVAFDGKNEKRITRSDDLDVVPGASAERAAVWEAKKKTQMEREAEGKERGEREEYREVLERQFGGKEGGAGEVAASER